jgi:hypothetical protein
MANSSPGMEAFAMKRNAQEAMRKGKAIPVIIKPVVRSRIPEKKRAK